MKIVRDEKEIELTFSELMLAYEEYRLDCALEDVKQICEEKDVELSDEEVSDVARQGLHGLGKSDSYFEAYWSVMEYYLSEYLKDKEHEK